MNKETTLYMAMGLILFLLFLVLFSFFNVAIPIVTATLTTIFIALLEALFSYIVKKDIVFNMNKLLSFISIPTVITSIYIIKKGF